MNLQKTNSYFDLLDSSSMSLEHKAIFSSWASDVKLQLKSQYLTSSKFSDLLVTIPNPDEAGCVPLISLAFLLSQYDGDISTFDLLRRYTQLWSVLPETLKADHRENGPLLDSIQTVIASVRSLPSLLLSDSTSPVLVDPQSRNSLTGVQLSSFIQDFSLPIPITESRARPVVVIALPNGALLGLACLAVASYYTAAPINVTGGPKQFQSDVELANPECILVLERDIQRLGLQEPWAQQMGIRVLVVVQSPGMLFAVHSLDGRSCPKQFTAIPNKPDDFVLILFTSGTSGTKKVVPVSYLSLLIGVSCVIDSWALTPEDRCLNMMPLNHVGGLVRNLFAPVLSGGSAILCTAFDPNQFWDILEEGYATWYYASPSMHMSILAEGSLRPNNFRQCQLRLVCNAAGALLPALATRLQDTFKCTVLPSYGMTECMPISTPPLNYTLDRCGTSGVPCGPEILIFDEIGKPLPRGQVGHINVRGGPTFVGYLKDGKVDKSIFNENGWFDTGDLGSVDHEGYLYLTGRGKEVINRGGEIISPFEVEEAITIASQDANSVLYGQVQQVLAFSVPHKMLQEVVGVALVCRPAKLRPDVRILHKAINASINSFKLPEIIVYIDALPTSNNKIVRIEMSNRLGLSAIAADTSFLERHFEAVCPPINSTLDTKISNTPCKLDIQLVVREVKKFLPENVDAHVSECQYDGMTQVFLAPKTHYTKIDSPERVTESLLNKLEMALDGFLLPSDITCLETPLPLNLVGSVDDAMLQDIVKSFKASKNLPAASKTEHSIRRAFAEVFRLDINEISSESDFFVMGGDSLSAGRLLSILRRDSKIRIPMDLLFTHSKVLDLSGLVDQIILKNADDISLPIEQLSTSTDTHSSTNPLVLAVNLLPILLIYPMKMGFQWTCLMYALSTISELWNEPGVAARFFALVAAMFMSRGATQIVAPIFGILFKWIVIGRYQEGMYPMWGPYHTRWWIVQKVLQICGKGVFKYFDMTRLAYYRLLGAKIGKGVVIEKGTTLGEYDLLEIGDNVHLDRCICRPFAAERNTSMYLGKITVGKDSVIGLKSHVAAGSVLPINTFIGPNSSSYEMNHQGCSEPIPSIPPKPHILLQIFCIMPIQVVVLFISSLPWMAGLLGIVVSEPRDATDSVRTIISWWASPHRIVFHYLALALNVSVRPFVWFGTIFIVKKILNLLCGVSEPNPTGYKTQKDNIRTHIMSALIPYGGLKSLTKLFGSHYESTSIFVRALGGRVGKRVYWPGTGPTIDNFDLIDIGDDVIFGSRSHIITSDVFGSNIVKVGDGAMIADRVVLSPGAKIGNRAVLGSGAFIRRNQQCSPNSVLVGNRKGGAVYLSDPNIGQISTGSQRGNSKPPSYPGSPQGTPISTALPSYAGSVISASSSKLDLFSGPDSKLKNESTSNSFGTRTESPNLSLKEVSLVSSPFGRAFYEGQAPYYVLGQIPIFIYSTFIAIFVQLYWNVGTISTIMMSRIVNNTDQFHPRWYRPLKIYAIDVTILMGLYGILSMLAISIVIAAKWLILGRRKAGSYDWDKSDYCQRWQLFLTIEALRRRCFGGDGIVGLITGTHFCVLYFRAMGAKIGKDCALFAGGHPSLVFTEPDLLTIGDRVAVDDASLVCHINSRGKFSLSTLSVGSRSVLRSGSRLLSGAMMGEDAALLEHTLIMAGDMADDGTTYQGWPADVFRGQRMEIRPKKS